MFSNFRGLVYYSVCDSVCDRVWSAQNIINQGKVSFMFENKMVYLNSLVHKQGFFSESRVYTILLELASILKNLSFQIFVVLHTAVYISGSRPPNTLQIRERFFYA